MTEPTYNELKLRVMELEGETAAGSQMMEALKTTEMALRKNEELFRNVYLTAPLAFVIWDTDTRITDWNEKSEEVFGWSKVEVVGRTFFDLIIPEKDRPHVQEVVKHLFNGDLPNHSINDNITKDGRVITCEWNNSVLHDDEGRIIGAISLGLDITERKQAEAALSESEGKYRTLTENTSDWVWEVDQDGYYTYSNPKVFDLLGYYPDEIIGKKPFDFMPQAESKKVADVFLNYRKSGKPFVNLENKNLHKNGQQVVLETSGVPFFDANGNLKGYRGIDRDLTHRKALEMGLQQARKMEAIATLAGGIAHQFNNALAVITGYLDLIEEDIQNPVRIVESIRAMRDSSQRMAKLNRQLLAYAKGGKYRSQSINICDFVMHALPAIKPNLPPGITLDTVLPDNIPMIEADETQLQMVLSSIILNSSEAVEKEGHISIKVSLKKIDKAAAITQRGLRPGRYVCLSVTDYGKGMDEMVKNRIFEPFFTTKYHGRGLGMAAVYGIIKNHNGYIDVESEKGTGTSVRIYLPTVENDKDG